MTGYQSNIDGRPWYQEPWPWIILGLLGSVIVASLITFWIAWSNPDALVVEDAQYREIKAGLRAQDAHADAPGPALNPDQLQEQEPATSDDGI